MKVPDPNATYTDILSTAYCMQVVSPLGIAIQTIL